MKRREALKQMALLGSALTISACGTNDTGGSGNHNTANISNIDNINTITIKNNFNVNLLIPNIEPYTMDDNHKKFNFNIKNGISKFL